MSAKMTMDSVMNHMAGSTLSSSPSRAASRSFALRMRSSWVARPTKASPPFWPTQEGAYAELVNPIPKYVASRTIKEPLTWNSHLLGPDPAEERGGPEVAGRAATILDV